eukprot:11613597-Ditylum_brightwellii.AAC.1
MREQYNSKCKISTSSSDNPLGTDKQPGEMLTEVGGSHVGRILESGEDKDGLGRWSWITLEGK